MQLRDYQEDLKSEIYKSFGCGLKRLQTKLQTGGGKTVVFCSMIKDLLACHGHVVLVVRRRKLIRQASATLDKMKIPHGVYMANHRRYRPNESVQICSIDTLDARSIYPHSNESDTVIIIDESHDCTPTSGKYKRLVDIYRNNHIVGFTATPYTDNSMFQKIICTIEAYELRDQGFLVPEKTYVPNIIDISSVRVKRNGAFDERELFEASSKSEIIGDFVKDWVRYAERRPTLLFAVNVEHSKLITESFNAAGIPAVHCDGSTNDRAREKAISDLLGGRIKVISNCDIFSTGADIPPVSCVQLCRPTQSDVWHLQSIGRGLRISPETGKKDCIILDNAGNTLRHGTAYKVREATIEPPKRRRNNELEEDISIRTCDRCHYVFDAAATSCPSCGFQNPKRERHINHVEGDLVQYEMSEEEKYFMIKHQLMGDVQKLCWVAKRNYKLNKKWVYYRLKDKYGVDTMETHQDIIIKSVEEFFTKRS